MLRDAVFWYDTDNALTNSQHLSGYLHKTYIRLKPIKLIARMGKVLMSSIPGEYHWRWWLLRERDLCLFCIQVPLVGCPSSGGWSHTHM